VPFYDLREERSWRHLDTMQFETRILCRVPRAQCPEDGVKTIKTPWAGKHGRFTLLFEAVAIQVLQACANVEDARKLLGINWPQLREIQKRAVERGLERRGEESIERVGMDEKSFGKGHNYVSVLSDLDGGRILEVEPERTQKAADKLILSLSEEQRKGVLAGAVDMWQPFMNALEKHLPEAAIVHDKFHVSKHLNDAVDQVRRAENKALLKTGNEQLKGSKYLFLKREENLSDEQREAFDSLRKEKLKSSRAWAIKDLFDEFWTFEFVRDAKAFFEGWYSWAIRSRLEPIKRKARMLKKHLKGLLNYTLHQVTNAATEGLNSKIQLIKSAARGFRSFKNYRIAILFHCGKLNMIPEAAKASQNS